eukprot:Skav218875  [mRNA]  locus=scaffold2503:50619:61327:- [translate_table: standard]
MASVKGEAGTNCEQADISAIVAEQDNTCQVASKKRPHKIVGWARCPKPCNHATKSTECYCLDSSGCLGLVRILHFIKEL